MRVPVRQIEGWAITLLLAHIDTDTIIPARHLKTIKREGLGAFAFEPIRQEPGNPFGKVASGAPILLAGENFGCGSSREHAVWAMLDLGLRAVIAPSFSDIFSGNAFKNGLLCIMLDDGLVAQIADEAKTKIVSIDLEYRMVRCGIVSVDFVIDAFRRECLLGGVDEIALTWAHEDAIVAYEKCSAIGPVTTD